MLILRAETNVWILAAMLAASVAASAQVAINPGAHPSQSDLTIRVRLQNEKDPPYPVQVQLIRSDGVSIMQDFTHDGRTDFRSITEGTYQIRVGGAEYVTYTSEPFTILHNEHMHNETVHVELKPAVGEKANKLISATELQVPEKARDLFQRSVEQFDAGAAEDAIQSLRAAIAIYPQYARAYNNLGIILISKDDLGGATGAFESSLKADDKFAPAMINLARLNLHQQSPAKAQTFAEKVLTIEPLNPEALTLLATAQFYQGKFQDAAITVDRLHTVPHDGFADAHLVAAEAYQKIGNNRAAIEQCKLFLKENPKSPRAEQVRQGMKVLEARQ